MLLAAHPIPTLEVSARIVNPDEPFSQPSEFRIRHTVVRKKLQSNKRCSIYTHTVECFNDPDEPDTPTQPLQSTSRAQPVNMITTPATTTPADTAGVVVAGVVI